MAFHLLQTKATLIRKLIVFCWCKRRIIPQTRLTLVNQWHFLVTFVEGWLVVINS